MQLGPQHMLNPSYGSFQLQGAGSGNPEVSGRRGEVIRAAKSFPQGEAQHWYSHPRSGIQLLTQLGHVP